MILILSENDDVSTNEVIDWLIYYNIEFCRINDTDKINIEFIEINTNTNNVILEINQKRKIDLSKIKSYWYRRGFIDVDFQINSICVDNKSLEDELKQFHLDESISLLQFVHLFLNNSKHINGFFDNRINKLYSLLMAKQIGLDIPNTKIVTNLKSLKRNENYINKAIRQGFSYSSENNKFLGFTSRVNDNFFDSNLENFFPTLFQNEIHKQFEIRSFYLHETFYSMAIFSQKNKNTEVDFRKYDTAFPNRNVPFSLPRNIEDKLNTLMKALNLNSGSIDLIVDKDDNFIFLEVNPIGQFRQVSKPCNFHIEKKIAEYLKK